MTSLGRRSLSDILRLLAEGRLSALLAASGPGRVCAGPTSPFAFDLVSHFSSRLRFWSARGTDVTTTSGSPALGGGRPCGSVLAFTGVSGARAAERVHLGLAICRSTSLAERGTMGPSAVVATALLSGTPLWSLETVAEVPFELYQHHLIVTKGSIGPLNGLSLLIDTGTIPSMVDVRIARKLHLQAEPSMLVAFGQSVAIQSTVLNGFRIGALETGPVPAGVSDLSYLDGVRIDAIIGLDVLARTSFSIDYRKRVLRFSPGGREESVAPLEPVWPFLTVRMKIAGQQVRLLVDTGSSDLVTFQVEDARRPLDRPGKATRRYNMHPAWRACSGSICDRSALERVSGTNCQPGRSIGYRTDIRRASTACSVYWP